jgi:hypothetical protein
MQDKCMISVQFSLAKHSKNLLSSTDLVVTQDLCDVLGMRSQRHAKSDDTSKSGVV